MARAERKPAQGPLASSTVGPVPLNGGCTSFDGGALAPLSLAGLAGAASASEFKLRNQSNSTPDFFTSKGGPTTSKMTADDGTSA
jgi:hypothetical protein